MRGRKDKEEDKQNENEREEGQREGRRASSLGEEKKRMREEHCG